jgi:hypothetical protein
MQDNYLIMPEDHSFGDASNLLSTLAFRVSTHLLKGESFVRTHQKPLIRQCDHTYLIEVLQEESTGRGKRANYGPHLSLIHWWLVF